MYESIYGYVKKSDTTIVDYEPVTKYALGTLSINIDSESVYLRESANHMTDNVVFSVENKTTLSYYGTIIGTCPMPATNSSTWYCVKITDNNTISHGYIYSAYVTAQPILPTEIEKVMVETTSTPEIETAPLALESETNIIIIIALCVPAIFVMLLLFRKNAPRKRSHRHYN